MKAEPRPLVILREQKPLMDAVKPQIQPFRQAYLEDRLPPELERWDPSVYMPMGLYLSLLQHLGGGQMPPEPLALGSAIACALHSWSMTRDVYRFDPEVAAQLITGNLKGEIPTSLLKRLPGWCLYIDVQGLGLHYQPAKRDVVGFFAHLDHDPRGWLELRLLFDVGAENVLFALPVPLKGSIEESLNSLVDTALIPQEVRGVVRDVFVAGQSQIVSQCLNLLLWLCSEEPDIVGKGQPSRPAPVRTKQGLREFPVSEPVRAWDVAYRYGSKLRLAEEQFEREQGTGEGRSRPRPHYRRPHWHAFWTGPRGGERVLVLRWVPRVPVNMEGVAEEDLPAVIHRVQE